MMHESRRPFGQAGMTLLELVLALATFAGMMALAWTVINRVGENATAFEQYEKTSREMRMALSRVVADFESAYISSNEDLTLQDRRTMFIASGSGTVPEIRFSTLGHRPRSTDLNESDQTLISYSSQTDPKNPSRTNWLRRESFRLSNKNWQEVPARTEVLLHGVEEVVFKYWSWKYERWPDRLDSTSEAEGNRLPTRVKIKVKIKNPLDEQGDPIVIETQARILLQEQVKGS